MYQEGKFVHIANRKAEELLAYLCVSGQPVKKERAAEVLWEDSSPENARDNLYKVCRYLRTLQKKGIEIPLQNHRKELYLDLSEASCDIREFQEIYAHGTEPWQWEKAVSLYTGPLLFDNYYEWTGVEEAYYDMRYYELLERLAADHRQKGREDMAALYDNKIKEFR